VFKKLVVCAEMTPAFLKSDLHCSFILYLLSGSLNTLFTQISFGDRQKRPTNHFDFSEGF